MSDTSNQSADTPVEAQAAVADAAPQQAAAVAAVDPAAPVVAAPVKPESWTDEAWDALEFVEQKVVAGLHEAGHIFSADIWPILKATLTLFFGQTFSAIFAAVSANIADPALIPAAVATSLLLTASTVGIVDAKNAIAAGEAAVAADPTVQALLKSNG